MIVLIDGPAKSGKSTFLQNFAEVIKPRTKYMQIHTLESIVIDHEEYAMPLRWHASDEDMHLWDEGWPHDSVYAKLQNQYLEISENQWLGEWLFGRGCILKIMMLPHPHSWIEFMNYRSTADPITGNLFDETSAFYDYALRFNYTILYNNYTPECTRQNIHQIRVQLENLIAQQITTPNNYTGSLHPKYVVVGGEKDHEDELPFLSSNEITFAQNFGDAAFKMGWTNKKGIDPKFLRNRIVISVGQEALDWVNQFVNPIVHISLLGLLWTYTHQDKYSNLNKNFISKLSKLVKEDTKC
jgi:energy-coupling factor transporter ATP-binding protein EcfA2